LAGGDTGAAFAKADHKSQTVQDGERQNEELLRLSNQILELTRAIHATARHGCLPAL
jgi:hypothetical protein